MTRGNSRDTQIVIYLLILGFVLRIYQIGRYSFWFDEAGVALAASAEVLNQTIAVAREHAAAMPMDYIVAWVMARVSLDEGWLRLPAALWGTLSLAAAYLVFLKLHSHKRAALWGVFFLATSPFFIHYSQELRFYTAWVFFYLLSSYLFLRALEEKRTLIWISLVVVALLGIYFHAFTLFFLLNGMAWVYEKGIKEGLGFPRIISMIGAMVAILLFSIPGYLYFCSEPIMNYGPDPLLGVYNIFIGLGFLPELGWEKSGTVYSLLFALFAFVGVRSVFSEKNKLLKGIFWAIVIQVAIISAGVFAKGYFFASRQFIHLFPFSCWFAAYGILKSWENCQPPLGLKIRNLCPNEIQKLNRILVGIFVCAILVSNLLAIRDYYMFPRSMAEDVSRELIQQWKPGDQIRVVPWYEPLLYRYYLENRLGVSTMSQAFIGIDIGEINQPSTSTGQVFLVMRYPVHPYYVNIIRQSGYQAVISEKNDHLKNLIWVKDQ